MNIAKMTKNLNLLKQIVFYARFKTRGHDSSNGSEHPYTCELQIIKKVDP